MEVLSIATLQNPKLMITKQMAVELGDKLSTTILYNGRSVGSDLRPVRARVNGKCQTWKRKPDDFRLPMKHGLRHTFQITPQNADDWYFNEGDAMNAPSKL